MSAFRFVVRMGGRSLAAALLALGVSSGTARAEKELHWRSLDVTARLDADGRLHVVERHVMVFTGDWNGGERIFRLFPGQKLSLEGVRRFDPATGETRDLVAGDLSGLDRYSMTDATTLRWRSRLPSAPEFDHTGIGYEIAYTLAGVLLKQGDRYVLDHNFALPAAGKPIEAFSVDLDLDPAWTPPPGFVRRRSAGSLVPGEDYVVHAELARASAAGAPAAVRVGTTKGTRAAMLATLLAATLLMGFAFYRREASLGRFQAPAPPDSIDEAWLHRRLFSLFPEEAGALWDDSIGASEVTAVLARLSAEKKLETHASEKEMTMRLLAPLDSFEGYEGKLLHALFFGGHTETSTSAIKAHYKSTGFDPAKEIEPGLRERLSGHADFEDRSGRPPRGLTFGLFLAGIALLVFEPLRGTLAWGPVVGALVLTGIFWGIGAIAAFRYQKRVVGLAVWSLSFLFVPLFFLWGWWRGLSSPGTSPLPALLGQLFLQLAVVSNLFNAARTRSGPRKIARRKELVAARRFFERELSKSSPRMKDAWFPWIAAFGLGPAVDRWFRSFGGAAASVSTSRSSGGFSGSSSSSGSGDSGGFTGGGGFSGGAGSSGSWAVAAGALAAGVSAPSSSSSGGGGGGGGGGSSGGGGGGGW
ncbi:MAG: DMT family transporter [Acidobacteriota bacterium]